MLGGKESPFDCVFSNPTGLAFVLFEPLSLHVFATSKPFSAGVRLSVSDEIFSFSCGSGLGALEVCGWPSFFGTLVSAVSLDGSAGFPFLSLVNSDASMFKMGFSEGV